MSNVSQCSTSNPKVFKALKSSLLHQQISSNKNKVVRRRKLYSDNMTDSY